MNTGNMGTLLGPNNATNYTHMTNGNTPDPSPDTDLLSLDANAAFGTVLEFDIVPLGDKVNFVLAFGSEEYPEFVCTPFNDSFGLFVSSPTFGKKNAAFIPNTTDTITVNNVNGGSPGAYAPTYPAPCKLTNTAYFTDNGDGSNNANSQLDGFTKPMTAYLNGLTAGETYHIKLALADAGDAGWDSGAFFKWLTSTDTNPIDMELSATASTLTPSKNGTVNVTYTVNNKSGTLDSTLVQTQLQWPAGVTVVSHDGGANYNSTNAVWDVGTVPPITANPLLLR